MPLHMRKLSVGSETVSGLALWQRENRAFREGKIWHTTRSWPRRASELLDGGSIYWIIKGIMQVRQPIIGFEEEESADPDAKPLCRILLAPELVRTCAWPHRPFQGWRYLKPEDAPPDLGASLEDKNTMPPKMAAELRALGLL